jgi:hypothetical protein
MMTPMTTPMTTTVTTQATPEHGPQASPATPSGRQGALRAVFDQGARDRRAVLVAYLTFGDPDPATSIEVLAACAEAGAGVIELGVPFSDPSADGPSIQRAMERALAAGGSLTGALDAVAALRARGIATPIVLFGYYNPVFVMGPEKFAARAAAAGVDAVLTVDLPIDELEELVGKAQERVLRLLYVIRDASGGRVRLVQHELAAGRADERTQARQHDAKNPRWDKVPSLVFNMFPHQWKDPDFLDKLAIYDPPYIKAVRDDPAESMSVPCRSSASRTTRPTAMAATASTWVKASPAWGRMRSIRSSSAT